MAEAVRRSSDEAPQPPLRSEVLDALGPPLAPELLRAAEPAPKRPFPWRPFAALLVPAGAMAAATGLQYLVDGKTPAGDALGRWLVFASVLGAVFGLVAGLSLAKGRARLLWFAWGALSAVLLTQASVVVVKAVRPVREAVAQRGFEACKAEGRVACTVRDFRAGCEAAGQAGSGARALAQSRLGTPKQELCDAAGCTLRWQYTGPWNPDDYVAPGSLLCSVVLDASGRAVRSATQPGTDPRDDVK